MTFSEAAFRTRLDRDSDIHILPKPAEQFATKVKEMMLADQR
jgi:hypothetical protein